MRSAIGLFLACTGCIAYGWTITHLKPAAQVLLSMLPLLALAVEVMSRSGARAAVFLVTASTALASGYLYGFPEMAARFARRMGGAEEPVMAISPLLIGAAAGAVFLAATILLFLRPNAASNRFRRAWLGALAAAEIIAYAIDRIPAGS